MISTLKDIARDSHLRVAINTGNRALVQRNGGDLSGISPILARRLADEIGAQMVPVIYDGAGKVFDDVDDDKWDVGFLAIDEKRAEKIAFTRAYIVIEATFAVRAASEMADVGDVDRAGVSVLTSTGSAYDMHLTKSLQHAALHRSGTPPESFADFREGRCDAVAGVRASLAGFFGDDPTVRILPGVLTSVRQAMVLPGADNPLISALDDFVARAIADGFVAAEK
jgi:polar amino acid transport system substrate-binding protein